MDDQAIRNGQVALRRVHQFGVQIFVCLGVAVVIMAGLFWVERSEIDALSKLQRASASLEQLENDLHLLLSPLLKGQPDPVIVPISEARFADIHALAGQQPSLELRVAVINALERARTVQRMAQHGEPKDQVSHEFLDFGYAVRAAKSQLSNAEEDHRDRSAMARVYARIAFLILIICLAKVAWFDNLRPLTRIIREWEANQRSLITANQVLEDQAQQIESKTHQLQQLIDEMEVQVALHGHASRRFQSLFDGLPVGCLTFDMEAMVFEINPQMGLVLGAPPHMFLLQNVCMVFGREEEQVEAFRKVLDKIGTTGNPVELEWTYKHHTGTKHLYLHVLPLRNSEGVVVGGICCALDVTHRRESEEALARSEAQIRTLIDNAPASIALIDRERRCLVATRAWLESNGLDPVDYRGHDLFELVKEAETHWGEAVEEGLAGQATVREEDIFIRHDGRIQWMTWSVLPWHRPDGQVGGIVMFQEDVTERREIEQRVRDSEERFELAVNAASVGIWDWNLDRNLMYWSPRLKEILGLEHGTEDVPHSEFVGRIHPDDEEYFGEALHSHLRMRTPFSLEARFRHEDGRFLWLHVRGQAIWSGVGRPTRMVGAVEDVSVRKAYEMRVAESESRFRDVVEASGEYIWECDTDMRYTYLSERFELVTGVSAGKAIGQKLTEFVRKHERERLAMLFKEMESRNTGFSNVTVESDSPYGIVCQRWNGVPVIDSEGKCTGFRGAGLDITLQRAAEDALFQANERIRGILEGIQDCFVSLDNEQQFTYVNQAAEDEFGQPWASLQGSPIWDVVPEEARDNLRLEFEAARNVSGSHVFEAYFPSAGRWIEYRVSHGRDGYSVFFHDVTQQKESQRLIHEQMLQINESNFLLEVQQMELQEANIRLSQMAETDALTGLFNRKKLNEVLDAAVGGSEPVGLIMLDVDHFKKYNDTFGHLAGDEVLKKVSAALSHAVGEDGMTARYGGEEFVVVVQGSSVAGICDLAERIRHEIESQPWELRPVTASFGVCVRTPGQSVRELVDRADAALYASKQSGRNRVTLADDPAQAA